MLHVMRFRNENFYILIIKMLFCLKFIILKSILYVPKYTERANLLF